MKLEKILEGSEHAMSLFGDKETRELEKKIVERPSKKGGVDYYVKCVCREKNVGRVCTTLDLYFRECSLKYTFDFVL